MKTRILFFALLFAGGISFANNLQITGVAVNQATKDVTFTLAWDNSWQVAAAPSNWDAVWVFVKWRLCTSGDGTAFTHGTLSATTADHSYTNLQAMTTVDGVVYTGSAPQGAALDKTDGIMLRPLALALGSISSSVSLKVPGLPPAGAGNEVTLSVFGIEMVYIPEGDFNLGDANGAGGRAANSFLSSAVVATATSMPITTAFETGAQTFFLDAPTGAPTTIANVPAAFPKGRYGYYIMKYEITEGLYAEFLNSLGFSSAAATARYPGNYTTNRNQLNGTIPPYTTTRSDRAQNWLSWADVAAFLDWACLRPMTELEYEKAARGPSASLLAEYPWGSTVISTGLGLTFSGAGVENGTETTTAGNCIYGNPAASFTNGDAGQGPARSGIFATAASTRVTAGASYYGVMELAGNVREVVVAMVSDVVGAGGSGVTNVFTRTWGDGAIVVATGIHNVAGGWPPSVPVPGVANNLITNLVGYKGGAWSDAVARLQVSDRNTIYAATAIGRTSGNGGRGVR